MVDAVRPPAGLDLGPEAMDTLRRAARSHGIRLLVAFGSQVTGQTHAASDVDVAVLLDHPEQDDSLSLMADLQDAFTAQVDVVWLHRADPLLRWAVLRQPQLLLGDPRDLARAQAYAWRRFVEYRPFFKLEAAAVRRAIARLRDGHR